MKSSITKHFWLTVILIFVLQAVMLAFIFTSFFQSSSANIRELGVGNLKSQATMIENYLNKGRDVLWFAAESVDFMAKNGADREEIMAYIQAETVSMQRQFDKNFTGIYGYLRGEYIDGVGWVPPADYIATERSWYTEAKLAGNKMVMTPPYIDAQTGDTVVSFSQMLSDGDAVIALDIVLNEVQRITENMNINGMGYGFIIDGNGLVIAHSDKTERGKSYFTPGEHGRILSGVFENYGKAFETDIDGEKCTVFSQQIADGLFVVIVVSNTKLFHDLWMQIIAGVLFSALIFGIIVVFCVISTRRIALAESLEQMSRERLVQVNMNIIRALTSTIDAKDRYTSGHSHRVADYALAIAKRMGKPEEEQQTIYYAGMLHDVGKIRIPISVINKPGKLTEEEFNYIRIHPVSGYNILRDIHDDERIGYGAKYHHERYDGKGYPNGLSGENIPEVARILAVADAYDAMASDRSYRHALPQNVIRSEIEKGKGTQFDPAIADIMLQLIDEDKGYEMRQKESGTKNILVVDADSTERSTVKEILRQMKNVAVLEADSAEKALSSLDENDISLILLDITPSADGFALCRHIREDKDIPIVIMTTEKSREILQRISEHNIDDYLTKPLNSSITVETVYGILFGDGSRN